MTKLNKEKQLNKDIHNILINNSEQVMFDGGESEWRFTDDMFYLTINELTNLLTKT